MAPAPRPNDIFIIYCQALPDPVVLTTATDFRVYRRHSRQPVPCVLPD